MRIFLKFYRFLTISALAWSGILLPHLPECPNVPVPLQHRASVRTRLIVLSLIPVVGFAAVAVAYLSSERAVEAAFESVQQSSHLSEASRAFKEALSTMQVRAKDFVAQPQPGLVSRFGEAHDAAIGEPEDDPRSRDRGRTPEPRPARRRALAT